MPQEHVKIGHTSGSTVSRKANRRERRTPYSCSTRGRKKRGVSPDFMPNHVPTTDELTVIKGMLSKTWVYYQLSPLWQFETSSSKLRGYSQLLSQHFNSQRSKFSSHGAKYSESNKVAQFVAKVSSLPRFGRDGSEGIEITVRLRGGNRSAPLCTAILCTMSQPITAKEGFLFLPILLSQGDSKLSQVLFDWLQSSFDCYLSPFQLEQDDLSLLVAQYATAEKVGRGVSCVELVYEAPESVKKAGLSTISLELPSESAHTLWDSTSKVIRERSETQRITSEQRESFIQALNGYIQKHFHLKPETMKLTRISTPVLHADKSGKLKFLSLSCVIPVLSALQSTQGIVT